MKVQMSVLLMLFVLCGIPLYAQNTGVVSELLTGVQSVALAPHQPSTIAVLSQSGAIYLWDLETAQLLSEFEISGVQHTGQRVLWSPNGSFLVGVFNDGVYVWNTGTGRLLYHLDPHPINPIDPQYVDTEGLSAITFSPSGEFFVTAHTYDQAVAVWRTATGEQVALLDNHSEGIWYLEFSPDGQYLAAGTWFSNQVVIWNTSTWRVRFPLYVRMRDFAFSPDSRFLATSTGHGWLADVIVWNIETGYVETMFSIPLDGLSIAWSADSETIFAASNSSLMIHDGYEYVSAAVRGWNISTSELVWDLLPTTPIYIPYRVPDNELLIALDDPDDPTGLLLVSRETGRIRRQVLAESEVTYTQYITLDEPAYLSMSPSGSRVAIPIYSGKTMIWDFDAAAYVAELEEPDQCYIGGWYRDNALLLRCLDGRLLRRDF